MSQEQHQSKNLNHMKQMPQKIPYDMPQPCTTRYAINHVLNKYQNSQDVHQT
jgi:hypothetical protein